MEKILEILYEIQLKFRGIKKFLIFLLVVCLLYPSVQSLRNFYERYQPLQSQAVLHIGDPNPETLFVNKEYSLTTYNLNYGYLGENKQFSQHRSDQEQVSTLAEVDENLKGIVKALKDSQSTLIFLQEVDRYSTRTHYFDSVRLFESQFLGSLNFAYTQKAKHYALFPWQVHESFYGGLMSFSHFLVNQSTRLALNQIPSRFSSKANLPLATALRQELNIEKHPQKLILYNLYLPEHLSVEEIKNSLKTLGTFLKQDRQAGHFVILGGSFGKALHVQSESKTVFFENESLIELMALDKDWHFGVDTQKATARHSQVNDQKTVQEGVELTSLQSTEDIFLVSSNINILQTYVITTSFEYSRHEPLKLIFSLKD